MEIVKTENLVYTYKRYSEDNTENLLTTALDGVDISIEKGEFIAVLGHNGSGKSTLAKHLNVLLLPTNGTIWINGNNTKDEENLWDIRQSAGMVFQNPDNQIIATIVEEDVAFGPENLGVPTEEIIKRVDNALENVAMTEHRDKSPDFLSGGQKQRVAIAGVLAMKPDCIILDEPTAMLDPIGRKEVINSVIKLNKEENITIILITHFMDEAVLADKVFVMEEGKVVIEGTPKEVFSDLEKLKSLRLDVPQVTELADRLQKDGIPLPNGILTIKEMVDELCQLK